MVIPDWMNKEHDDLRTEFQKLAKDWRTAEAQRDAALDRAEKAGKDVNMLRFELKYVYELHKHGRSALLDRITKALEQTQSYSGWPTTTPEPTEEETA